MSDEPKRNRKRKRQSVLLWILAAFMLYVLSAGPADILIDESLPRTLAASRAMYSPLKWAFASTETTQSIATWYIRLWQPLRRQRVLSPAEIDALLRPKR
jgi:hypothetical protein